MTARPIILVPPSEGKATAGEGPAWRPGTSRFSELDAARERVAASLVRAMRGGRDRRKALLGVSGDALEHATTANRTVRESATMPAIDRYTGVLYGALDHRAMPRRSQSRAADQLVVFSGLWGLLSPIDPIPDYKLKMGASLAGLGKLSTWWRPWLTDALAAVTEGRVVWDLLPNEHAAAWAPDDARLASRIHVRFVDRSVTDGVERLVVVSHWNKLLKGALVRHVLATQLDDPSGLEAFDHPLGYRYAPSLTTRDGNRVTVSLIRGADTSQEARGEVAIGDR